MKKELISVIMSTYNEDLKDIDRAIKSILNQTYENFEFIIICDKPDNDKLIKYLERVKENDKRIRIYINNENLGLTSSLNKALGYVNGTYIARMDADDFSLPNRFVKQKEFLEHMKYDLVGSYVECVDGQGESLYYLKNMPVTFSTVKKKVVFNNPLAHPTWFGKKEVFDENKGYRNIPYAEDYDFLLRAIKKGFKLGNIAEILFKYTIRDSSISTSNGLKQYLVSQALIKAYKNDTLHEIDTEYIHYLLKDTKKKNEDAYAKAAKSFSKAVKKVEKRNITFVFDLMRACFSSTYYFKKILGYIKTFH